MSVKVYIHYEVDGAPEKTSKLSVPKSWVTSKTVADVINLFAEAYNKTNPNHAIIVDDVHLETSEAMRIYSDDKIDGSLVDRFDYFIRPGKYVRQLAQTANANAGKLRCRNYGCNQFYSEESNAENSCCHHSGPPIFHDLVKYWSCCPDRKAYDWDDFQKLSGCCSSKHSTVDPKVALGVHTLREYTETPSSDAGEVKTVLKSISDYNTQNPNAASATSSAVKLTTQERKSTRREDGTAQCRNKGCNKVFPIVENNPTACSYHKGQPIFHDAIKYWTCCSDRKCYDFESFMAVPGCMSGYHDDGVINLETGQDE